VEQRVVEWSGGVEWWNRVVEYRVMDFRVVEWSGGVEWWSRVDLVDFGRCCLRFILPLYYYYLLLCTSASLSACRASFFPVCSFAGFLMKELVGCLLKLEGVSLYTST
jgi:hypothetical protein